MVQDAWTSDISKDPFLDIIKQYRNAVVSSKIRKEYDDFISEHENSHNGWIWPWEIGNLDPKLLIVYAPYFIKTFGFPDWYNAFAVTKDWSVIAYEGEDIDYFPTTKAFKYLSFIQKNVDSFGLNETEKEIVLVGKPIEIANSTKDDWSGRRRYWLIDDVFYLLIKNRLYKYNDYLAKCNTYSYSNNIYRYPLCHIKDNLGKQCLWVVSNNRYTNNQLNTDRGFSPSGDTGVEDTECYIIGLSGLVKKYDIVTATPFAAIGRRDGSYSILCSADGKTHTNSEIEDILENYEDFRSSIIISENEIKQLDIV